MASLRSFSGEIQILPTKTKPKKLVMNGKDGQRFGSFFFINEFLLLIFPFRIMLDTRFPNDNIVLEYLANDLRLLSKLVFELL